MSAIVTRDGQTLHINADIDFGNADACCDAGLALIAQMGGDVVADLSGVKAASSVSVAVLLRWARAVAARGGALRLAGVPDKCRAIVSVSGLKEALPEVAA